MHANRVTFASAILLATGASAQSVFVVAPVPGPGVFSTDIQPAINAAADGDLVLVKAGSYTGFTMNAKGVSVVADSGASVVVNGLVFLTQISASQRALLQGLTVKGDNALPAITAQIVTGPLWIESCNVTGGVRSSSGLVGVSVNSCPSVVIERCVITGGNGGAGGMIAKGAPALHVAASAVTVSDTQCFGGSGAVTFSGGGDAGFGGPGLRVLPGSIFVFASGSTFKGGNGAAAAPPQFTGGDGAPGINTEADVTLLQCTVTPGVSAHALPQPPPIILGGAGTATTLPGVARHFSTTSPKREGQTTTITAGGVGGELAGFLFSPSPGPLALLIPFAGTLEIAAASADAFGLGAIPAGGSLATPIVLPSLPAALQSTIVWCQGFFFDAPLTYVVLGPASALVILDASL